MNQVILYKQDNGVVAIVRPTEEALALYGIEAIAANLNMFTENKYFRWYCNLIEKAATRLSIVGYKETHHIIPKCMGGDDSNGNLVHLTAKEHFVAHHLLTKFTLGQDNKKMIHAFWMMCNAKSENQIRDFSITSTVYQSLKVERSKILSKPMPLETRRKISESTKGVPKPPKSEEKKKQISENLSAMRKGKSPWNKGTRGLQSHSNETRDKMSKSSKRLSPSPETIKKLKASSRGMATCFDKQEEVIVKIPTEVFRENRDRHIGVKSKDYIENYRGKL